MKKVNETDKMREAVRAQEIINKTKPVQNKGITPVVIDGKRYDVCGTYKVEIIGETETHYIRKNDCKVLKATK